MTRRPVGIRCSPGRPSSQWNPSDFYEDLLRKISRISADDGVQIEVLEYRVLGPLMVLVDGRPMRLGGRRQQLVLATLLSRPNLTVSQDLLIDLVWAGDPPEAAKSTLQSYVYGLRRVLGPDSILRRGEGYLVEVGVGSFDAMRFEDLLNEGRRLAPDDPGAASNSLFKALAMWHGSPYEGLESSPALLPEITRLEELRLAAIEMRNEAELRLGNHGALVSALDALVREHPLRERFRAQQMLALYRGGRQAEALRAYQEARVQLGEELGIEPSRELQDLEQRILDQDPALGAPVATVQTDLTGNEAPPLRGYEITELIGSGDYGTVYRAIHPAVQRDVAIKVIKPELANAPEFVRSFEREAQTVAQLDHPHILALYDYWREPDGAYLVMPNMRGGNLESGLSVGGWSLPRAVTTLEQLAGALAHAHRRGVTHRDVKPANVLLDSDGNAYLSDFGMARFLEDSLPGVSPSPNGSRSPAPDGRVLDIQGLAFIAFHLLTGVSPNPRWPLPKLSDARPDLPSELARVLDRAIEADPSVRYQRVEDFIRAFKQVCGADVVTVPADVHEAREQTRNPYKGLRAFRAADAADFFGREALIDELLGAVASRNVVVVVGPSGSGKSSVVRAGLIPAIRARGVDGADDWIVTDMFPGSHPFEELEAAMLKVAVDRPSNLLAELTDDGGLLRISKRILPSEDARLLLLVDQFEEMFSTVRAESTRKAFIDNLVAVAADERSRVKIVLTLRADFLDRPLAYNSFAEVVGKGLVAVGPPSREGLAQAIAAPARTVGVDVEPGLIGRIVSDVENQPAALPLLQFTLAELFETREGPSLSIAAYDSMGGVRRALGSRAEELFAEMSDEMGESVRQMFMRLVNVSEEGEVTRRRVSQAELRGLAIDQRAIDLVLDRFGSVRLISFDRDPVTRNPTVELAHEALLEEWERLRIWVEDHREALITARRISVLTREWENSGNDPSFLLRGSRLHQSRDWLQSTDLAMTDDERLFIATSVEAEQAEEDDGRRRRRTTIYSMAAALGLTVVLALAALWQWESANTQARQAIVHDLATDSVAALDEDPELALLLALESAETSIRAGDEMDPASTNALLTALESGRLENRLDKSIAVEFAGPLLVTIKPDGSIAAQSSADGTPAWSVGDGLRAERLAASPDGSLIAASYRSTVSDPNARVVILEVRTGSEVASIPIERSGAMRLDWSDDGRLLAVIVGSDADAELFVIDVPNGDRSGPLQVASAHDLVVLADDTIAVSNPTAGMIIFVDEAGEMSETPIETPGFAPGPMAYDNKAHRLVLASTDAKRVQAWDLSAREMSWEFTLPHPASSQTVLDISATTGIVAVSGGDRSVTLIDGVSGTEELALRGHMGAVTDIEFDREGNRLAASVRGDATRIWNVTPGGIDTAPAGPEAPCGLVLSPDGTRVAITGTDGTFSLVEFDSESFLHSIPNQGIHWGSWAALSRDFQRMAWVDQDGVGRVWAVDTGEQLTQLPPCHRPVALNHDGSLVVAEVGCEGRKSGVVIDTTTGKELLDLGEGIVLQAAFASVGGAQGEEFILANRDVVVEIYDPAGEKINTVEAAENDYLVFATDDQYLATGSELGIVSVYSLRDLVSGATAEEATTLRVDDTATINGIAIGGRHLATSSFGMLKVWDIHTGALLAQPQIVTANPPFSAFSTDGRTLIYTDGQYQLRRLVVDQDDLLRYARERLTRDFSQEECTRYLGPEGCELGDA